MPNAPADELDQFIRSSENEIQFTRRIEIVKTIRAFRDSKFRPAVLQAYRYKCAVCGCALKLVDAAHIVPVTDPRSTDDVTNGLALCRLHHGAYDNALLGVRSDYRVVVNSEAERRLAQLSAFNLNAGLVEFKKRLPKKINLPSEPEVRPDPAKLILGMRARQWPAAQVG